MIKWNYYWLNYPVLLTSTRGIACPCGDPCRTSNRGFLSLHWNCNIRNFREFFARSWRYIQCGVLSPDHTRCSQCRQHYSDVIMNAMASQITGISIVYSTVCCGADKKNIKAPCHWPLRGEFTGDRWIPLHKGPVTRKKFPFDDIIMHYLIQWWPTRRV